MRPKGKFGTSLWKSTKNVFEIFSSDNGFCLFSASQSSLIFTLRFFIFFYILFINLYFLVNYKSKLIAILLVHYYFFYI